ncbi:MAG: hypothetical protein SVW57_12500 [Thermodesulfobacteriota bacterium]|nr:hypothetical protein [Thermodesulfobacteriota bacterium]
MSNGFHRANGWCIRYAVTKLAGCSVIYISKAHYCRDHIILTLRISGMEWVQDIKKKAELV